MTWFSFPFFVAASFWLAKSIRNLSYMRFGEYCNNLYYSVAFSFIGLLILFIFW